MYWILEMWFYNFQREEKICRKFWSNIWYIILNVVITIFKEILEQVVSSQHGRCWFSLYNGSSQKVWLQDRGPVLESLDLELYVLTREVASEVRKSSQTGKVSYCERNWQVTNRSVWGATVIAGVQGKTQESTGK